MTDVAETRVIDEVRQEAGQEVMSFCPGCGTMLDGSIASDRLVRDLRKVMSVAESIRADLLGMPKFLEPTHATSLGRLSAKLEEMRREALTAAQLADYLGRHVTP